MTGQRNRYKLPELIAASEESGICIGTLKDRIYNQKMSLEEAVAKPLRKSRNPMLHSHTGCGYPSALTKDLRLINETMRNVKPYRPDEVIYEIFH